MFTAAGPGYPGEVRNREVVSSNRRDLALPKYAPIRLHAVRESDRSGASCGWQTTPRLGQIDERMSLRSRRTGRDASFKRLASGRNDRPTRLRASGSRTICTGHASPVMSARVSVGSSLGVAPSDGPDDPLARGVACRRDAAPTRVAYAAMVRPRGEIGIVVPGDSADSGTWDSFRSDTWWHELWDRSGVVDTEVADEIPGGRALWCRFLARGRSTGGFLGSNLLRAGCVCWPRLTVARRCRSHATVARRARVGNPGQPPRDRPSCPNDRNGAPR